MNVPVIFNPLNLYENVFGMNFADVYLSYCLGVFLPNMCKSINKEYQIKFKCLKVGLFGLMLASSWQASSNIISYNGYELNENIVSKGNLEWLQWSQTDALSIPQALSSYEQDGWNVASNSQVNTLFEAFGFTPSNENYYMLRFDPYTADVDEDEHDNFVELFGATHEVSGGKFGSGVNAKYASAAHFGLDDDEDGRHNRAMVASDNLKFGNPNPARTHLTSDTAGKTSYNSSLVSYGVALVRTIEVGEPSAFVIIALGIMGLASRRFKK